MLKRIGRKEREYVLEVLESQFKSSAGSIMVERLEELFSSVFGSQYGIAFVNGTATLHAALAAAGVSNGDEVIVPPLTMASTALAVLHANATPVFADIDPSTWTISPQSITECLSERTKAIIPVSIYGLSPDLDEIMRIGKRNNLFVLEDDAQCFMGKYKGRTVGTLGHAASFSFQSSKHLTSGEGGMIITNDEKFADEIRRFNSLGYKTLGGCVSKISKANIQDPTCERHISIGWNYRMPELCAAVALAQVERLNELVDLRVTIARIFREVVSGCSWLVEQRVPEGYGHTYWAYTLRIKDGSGITWHDFRNKYLEFGGDGIYAAWQLTYLEPAFKRKRFSSNQLQNFDLGLCAVAENIQPFLLQFKTNYFDIDIAAEKSDALSKTISYFGRQSYSISTIYVMNSLIRSIDSFLNRLFPIARSITGRGNRKTLRILQEILPLKILEYPSGTSVYDWVIPKEWIIRDAWIKNSNCQKVVDFKKSNLHIVSHSIPVHAYLSFDELYPKLHYIKDLPEAIPYRTAYYTQDWGFCLSYNDFNEFIRPGETYEVMIDSEFIDGSMALGELIINGKSAKEILISTYICHPSLANDNLSGIVLTAILAQELMKTELNHTFRIVFLPETIGAIAYCAHNEEIMKEIDAGFVVTTVGGPGELGYKQSIHRNHPINRIVEQAFDSLGIVPLVYPFAPSSDERQYSSQAFGINTVSITKNKYYEYEYYHTSLDNLDFVKAEYIAETLSLYIKTIDKFDKNICFLNLKPHCETMLSKHGLYPEIGGKLLSKDGYISEPDTILWLLLLCDGTVPLVQISERINVPIENLYTIASKLEEKVILRRV